MPLLVQEVDDIVWNAATPSSRVYGDVRVLVLNEMKWWTLCPTNIWATKSWARSKANEHITQVAKIDRILDALQPVSKDARRYFEILRAHHKDISDRYATAAFACSD